LTLSDLAEHQTEIVEPISVDFDGYTVHETPPNGQGLTALIALKIVEKLDIKQYPHNSPKYLHILLESLRLAFADTRYYVTDPKFKHVPVKDLLSEVLSALLLCLLYIFFFNPSSSLKEYISERAKLISLEKTLPKIHRGGPFTSSDTVYFAVVDKHGNACSFIVRLQHFLTLGPFLSSDLNQI